MARVTDVPRTPLGEEMETAESDWVACSVHASMFVDCGGEKVGAPSCVYAGSLGKIAMLYGGLGR